MQQDFQYFFQAPKAICHIFLLLPTAFMFLTKKSKSKKKGIRTLFFLLTYYYICMYCARWFKHFLTHFSKLRGKVNHFELPLDTVVNFDMKWQECLNLMMMINEVNTMTTKLFANVVKNCFCSLGTIFCAFVNLYKIYKNWKYFAFFHPAVWWKSCATWITHPNDLP